MKIALEPQSPIIGYRNLSISGQNPLCEKANWTDLSALKIEDNSVEEIRAVHLIGKIHYTRVADFLRQWHTKLMVGGLLRIEALDAICVGNKIANNSWNLMEMNNILFGQLPSVNISMYTLAEVRAALEEYGFKIESAGIEDIAFYINARKG